MEIFETSTDEIIGEEFLTWLWYRTDKQSGYFSTLDKDQGYNVYIEQNVVVKGGEKNQAATASVVGELLKEAKTGLLTVTKIIKANVGM